MSTWYYAGAEREQLGPVSTDELKQYFHSERIGLDTLVWRDGMLHWRPLQELAQQLGLIETPAPVATGIGLGGSAPGLPPAPPPATEVSEQIEIDIAAPPVAAQEPIRSPAAPAASAGRAVFNLGTEPSPVPAYVRPSVVPVVAEAGSQANPYASGYAPLQGRSAALDEDVVYAGFWKRVAASIIDGIIMSIAGGLCAELFGAILADLVGGGDTAEVLMTLLMTVLINACYYAWFHSTLNYATPGKMAIGIKLVRGDGESTSFLRAFARFFAMALSAIPLGLGYIMAGFTRRKQALHDLICDTVVVDKWAYTSQPERQRTELGTVTIVVLALYGLAILVVFIGFFVLGFSALSRF